MASPASIAIRREAATSKLEKAARRIARTLDVDEIDLSGLNRQPVLAETERLERMAAYLERVGESAFQAKKKADETAAKLAELEKGREPDQGKDSAADQDKDKSKGDK